jgi:hypothetical protein
MNEKNDLALVRRPPSALEKAEPGAKRILSGMVADALALADEKQTAPAVAKFRIGDYEWCEPDYRQILLWAKALRVKPEVFIERLRTGTRLTGEPWKETRFSGGRLVGINWDFPLLPLENLEWVEGLRTTHLSFYTDFERSGNIPALGSALPDLTHLDCHRLCTARLDLSRTPKLVHLYCSYNRLTAATQGRCMPHW